MRLDKFDLNLLVAFDVLIEERNVTHAAKLPVRHIFVMIKERIVRMS